MYKYIIAQLTECTNTLLYTSLNVRIHYYTAPGKSGPGLTSSGGLVAGVLFSLTIIIITVTVLVALLLWYG